MPSLGDQHVVIGDSPWLRLEPDHNQELLLHIKRLQERGGIDSANQLDRIEARLMLIQGDIAEIKLTMRAYAPLWRRVWVWLRSVWS